MIKFQLSNQRYRELLTILNNGWSIHKNETSLKLYKDLKYQGEQ